MKDRPKTEQAEVNRRKVEAFVIERILQQGFQPTNDSERLARGGSVAVVVRACDVKEEPVEWLWPSFIPCGMLTLLVSPPKCGKSLVMTWLAAIVSQGEKFPSGPTMPTQLGACTTKAPVLIIAYEDDYARTIKPRLKAAGADEEQIHFFEGINHGDGDQPTLDSVRLAEDFEHIAAEVRKINPALVIIDPVMAGFGSKCDTNSDNEVREVLGPFKRLAEETRAAFVFVTHTNKRSDANALDAAIGSRAFTGICRMVLRIIRFKTADHAWRSALLQTGTNMGAQKHGLVFEIKSQEDNEARAYVEWIEEYAGDADAFQAEQERQARDARRQESSLDTLQSKCEQEMLAIVKHVGSIESKELDAQLAVAGHPPYAIARSRTTLIKKRELEKDKQAGEWLTKLAGEPQDRLGDG